MSYLNKRIGVECNIILQYKFDFLVGIISDLLPICVYQFIWSNLYSYENFSSVEYDIENIKLYSLLALVVTSIYGNSVIETLGNKITRGDIVFDLVKPISIVKEYLYNDISRIIGKFITQYIPVCSITMLIFSISFNHLKLIKVIQSLFLLCLGYCIMFQLCFFVSMFSAWFVSIYNCRFIITQIIKVCSGAVIPLWMWPTIIHNMILKTPFPYIISAPISLLLDISYETSFINIIKTQLIWIIVLFVGNLVIYKKFRKRLNIQGG